MEADHGLGYIELLEYISLLIPAHQHRQDDTLVSGQVFGASVYPFLYILCALPVELLEVYYFVCQWYYFRHGFVCVGAVFPAPLAVYWVFRALEVLDCSDDSLSGVLCDGDFKIGLVSLTNPPESEECDLDTVVDLVDSFTSAVFFSVSRNPFCVFVEEFFSK